jgi:hypothetical protein
MATQRRTNVPEKTVLSHAEIKAEPKSNIAPAVPSFVHLKAMQLLTNVANIERPQNRSIIFKLLAFTFAMITFPIGSYFLSVNMLFGGMSCHIWSFHTSPHFALQTLFHLSSRP